MFYTYLASLLTTPSPSSSTQTANGLALLENKPKTNPGVYIAVILLIIALGVGFYFIIKK